MKRLLTVVLLALTLAACHGGQTYWYCWDSGAPAPHHLGHPVAGDHYCTAEELNP
jgi:hypothetical protein